VEAALVVPVVVVAEVKEEEASFPSVAAEAVVVVASFQKLQNQIQQPVAAEGEAAGEEEAETSAKAEQHQEEAFVRQSPQLHLRSLRTWYWASVGRRSFARTFATDSTLPASSRRDFRVVPEALRRCLSRRPRNRSSS